MKVIELTKTCFACPSQWDAKLDDDLWAYIRFRHGRFTARVGKTPEDAVGGALVIELDQGHPMDGVMTDSEMLSILVEWGWEIDPTLISEESKVEEDYSWMDVDEEDL